MEKTKKVKQEEREVNEQKPDRERMEILVGIGFSFQNVAAELQVSVVTVPNKISPTLRLVYPDSALATASEKRSWFIGRKDTAPVGGCPSRKGACKCSRQGPTALAFLLPRVLLPAGKLYHTVHGQTETVICPAKRIFLDVIAGNDCDRILEA